jgi:hypothetical protein
MTLIQAAVLLIRIASISLFVDAAITITEIPVMISDILKSQIDYITSEREFTLAMLIVRLFLYIVASICFLIFSRPLGKLFVRGLESVKND